MMEVVGIGALNWDRLYFVDEMAQMGHEVPVKSVNEGPGGSAANTIVGLARLGLRTGFVGRVGNDAEGDLIVKDMAREGVDTAKVQRSGGRSGMITGIVDRSGERTLYAYPGANNELEIEKEDLDYIRGVKFLHMSSFVGERSLQGQKDLIKELSGVKLSFSPGALYASRGLRDMAVIVKSSDVLFLNREEIETLTGQDYKTGAGELNGLGAKNVVVTLGKDGCLITTGDGQELVKGSKSRVVDTTGAGDAFAAGFLYGIVKDENTITAAHYGNYMASKCIEEPGARGGLPRSIS